MTTRGVLQQRAERAMNPDETAALMERAAEMRLGAVDRDGWPYVIPLSFVYEDMKVFFHHTAKESHLTSCLENDPRVCVEVDEVGPVVVGGESACDASRIYASVVAFGRSRIVTDLTTKQRFFDGLVAKHSSPGLEISRSYPRIESVLVFEIDIEVMTGKRRGQS